METPNLLLLSKEQVLKAAQDYSSAWSTTEEINAAKVSFIHAVQWCQSINKNYITAMEEVKSTPYRDLRILAALTLKEAALQIGIDIGHLSMIETGKLRKPQEKTRKRVTDFYTRLKNA